MSKPIRIGGHGEFHGVVTVGERGQIVIPADIREEKKIRSGDKLVIISKQDGPIGLIPADEFNRFINEASKIMSKIKKKL